MENNIYYCDSIFDSSNFQLIKLMSSKTENGPYTYLSWVNHAESDVLVKCATVAETNVGPIWATRRPISVPLSRPGLISYELIIL